MWRELEATGAGGTAFSPEHHCTAPQGTSPQCRQTLHPQPREVLGSVSLHPTPEDPCPDQQVLFVLEPAKQSCALTPVLSTSWVKPGSLLMKPCPRGSSPPLRLGEEASRSPHSGMLKLGDTVLSCALPPGTRALPVPLALEPNLGECTLPACVAGMSSLWLSFLGGQKAAHGVQKVIGQTSRERFQGRPLTWPAAHNVLSKLGSLCQRGHTGRWGALPHSTVLGWESKEQLRYGSPEMPQP